MDKFIIDNMGKKEILELFSPYASIPDTPASRYYDVIRSYDIKLELVEDIKYPQGRIRIHAKGYPNLAATYPLFHAELRDFIQSEMISIIRNRKLDEIL